MTPHIEAKENEIAKTVLMPGDPLRAKYIANKYLTNPKLVNQVRGILAYTGTYKDKDVTIMASGMGMPSIGIYSYELFKFYNVDNIIRVGSCGVYTKDINLRTVILVEDAYTESSFAKVYNNSDEVISKSNEELNSKIKITADKLNMNLITGRIHSTDVFYTKTDYNKLYNEYKCLGAEMESFALFHIANSLNKKATCLLTVSDNIVTNEKLSIVDRQESFDEMITLALESIL